MQTELQKLAENRLHTTWSLVAFDQEARASKNIQVTEENFATNYNCEDVSLTLSTVAKRKPNTTQFNQACKIAQRATQASLGENVLLHLNRS